MDCLSALTRHENGDYRSEDNRESDENYEIRVAGEEREDLWSIDGTQEGKERVTEEAPDCHGGQEFRKRILHGAGGDHEGN